MLGRSPKTLQMSLGGMEQIPDPEVCPVLGPVAGGRWIQNRVFGRSEANWLVRSATETLLLPGSEYLIPLVFLRTRELRFLASMGNWKPTVPVLGCSTEMGTTNHLQMGLFIVVTLLVLCSAPLGVMFPLSLSNKASLYSREGLFRG